MDIKDEVFSLLDGLRESKSIGNMDRVVQHLEVMFSMDRQTARSYLEDWMRFRKNNRK